MDDDDDDADLDTHMCLRCQALITGLRNYVYHKRQLCPAMLAKTDDTNVIEEATSRQGAEDKPQPDEFFSSLELQSRKTDNAAGSVSSVPVNKTISKRGRPKRSVQGVRFTAVNKKRKIESNSDDFEVFVYEKDDEDDDNDDFDYDYEPEEEEKEDEDEDDVTRPPKGHTGGKWKPGSMPNGGRRHDAINVKTENVSSMVAVDDKSASASAAGSYRCTSCDVTTQSEDSFVEHLMEPSHWTIAQSSHPDLHEALVLRHSSAMASHAPFRCDICKFYFNKLEHLVNHWSRKWKRHSLGNAPYGFNCSICSAHLKSSRSVVKHLNANADCHVAKVCCKSPLRISAMSKLEFPCSSCSYVARTSAAMAAHFRRNHTAKREKLVKSSSKDRNCRFCSAMFSALGGLKEHMAKVHPCELLTCKSCDRSFFSKSQHYKHMKDCNNVKTGKTEDVVVGSLVCKSCDFSCNVKAELLFHETLHTEVIHVKSENVRPKEQKRYSSCKLVKAYTCPECEQLLPKGILMNHLLEHTGEKPYKCSFCGVGFASKNSLYQHEKGNHSEKNLACPQCDFKTYKKFRLQRHLTTHEVLRPRPYLCEMCGADFLEGYALRYHMKLHVGDKCHKCSFEGCDKAYRSASELIVHVRTHTDERPFLCTECGYAAKTRHQLTKHERKHNGQRPFKCPHCPYAAKLSAQLWRHVRTHTGARPYSCPHCTYTCNTSENLRKHVLKSKKHQGLKIYICPYCADFGCNHLKEFHEHVINNHKETINSNESITPTYLSLLSGVYDKNASSTCVAKDHVVVEKEQTDEPADIPVDAATAAADAVADADAAGSVVHCEEAADAELRESLAFLKAAQEFDLKSEPKLEEITMVSIELVEHSEETVVTSDRFTGSPNDNSALLEDGETSILATTCNATLNTETNTIVIYVPMQ